MRNPLTSMFCAVTRALTTVDDALDVWDPLYEDTFDSAGASSTNRSVRGRSAA